MLVGVGWCVCRLVLVGMCRQGCALIVAHCACACACMSARVNACSSTAGLDLTTSSGDHRARPNNTASLVVRQWPLPPRPNLPICSSRRAFACAPRERRPTSTARSGRWGRPVMITEAGAHFSCFCQKSSAKVAKPRLSPWSCCQHRLSRPSTSAICFKTTGQYETC